MSNPIITGIYNIQTELSLLPNLVSAELTMQGTLIKRSGAITSDAITNKAKESEIIDYAEIFNTTTAAAIFLYIYQDDMTYTVEDLQFTANEIALLTPVFVPYQADTNSTTSITCTSPVSSVSNIDVIFNIANVVETDVTIETNPNMGTGSDVEKLRTDFIALFQEQQTIGKAFDEAFYQRTLFISGLSSMSFTASITDCMQYEILRLGTVTINGV
jgi:hypothetical protein